MLEKRKATAVLINEAEMLPANKCVMKTLQLTIPLVKGGKVDALTLNRLANVFQSQHR